MLFILQNKEELELYILKNKIRENKYIDELMLWETSDFDKDVRYSKKIDMKKVVVVGDIPFVQAYLKKIYNIQNMNPIEIPECLRTDEFLKRKYSIVEKDDIPKEGNYFVKDVNKLKSFTYGCKDIKFLERDKLEESLYQVSEFVDILSEYRVYIIDGKIECISNYNGDPCVLPDINLIKKANNIYTLEKDYPKSYSIDIMCSKKGTHIIEIHPWCCLGLYNSLWGNNILFAYRQGLDYYINYNTKITKFSNF